MYYHLSAPPYAAVNSPYNLNNLNGKWYFSGEDYRYAWRVSRNGIESQDLFWVSAMWSRKNQFSTYVNLAVIGTLSFTGVSGNITGCVSGIAPAAGLHHLDENGAYQLANTPNTPYTPDELNEKMDELYPGIRDAYNAGVDFSETFMGGGQNNYNARAIGGTGGYHDRCYSYYRWAGHGGSGPQANPSAGHNWYSTGQMNTNGSVVEWRTPTRYEWQGPDPRPVLTESGAGLVRWVWQTDDEVYTRSLSPGRGGISIGVTGRQNSQAYVWDKYGYLGIPQPDEPNISVNSNYEMQGPACVDSSGVIYCFNRAVVEISGQVNDNILSRKWTHANHAFYECIRACVSSNNLYLMMCDTGETGTYRSLGLMPVLMKRFENPFGFVTLSSGAQRAKVPQGMYVIGGYLYALLCDDTNPFDFRWICKYAIGELGLSLEWKKEPEHEWQCFHSFAVRGSEVWVTVTASDEQVFSNPTTWIGYNDDGQPPL